MTVTIDELTRFADKTYIRWERDDNHPQTVHHGHLMPGGDHLVTVTRQGRSWAVEPDTDAIIDLGRDTETLTVPGQFPTAHRAMQAAQDELAALLRRLTSTL